MYINTKPCNQLRKPPHLEHPKALQLIYFSLGASHVFNAFLLWNIDAIQYITNIYKHKTMQSAAEAPTLRTSQGITTDPFFMIFPCFQSFFTMRYWPIQYITYSLYKHKTINQLRKPPHLEHPKALQLIYFSWFFHVFKAFLLWDIDIFNT